MQTAHLDVRISNSPLQHPRVGLIVPKHRQNAVDRNRLRRRLRELIRIELLPHLGQGDALIRAKPEAYEVSFGILQSEIGAIRFWIARLDRR